MIERAVAAGVPAKWVTADAVYGWDYNFRIALENKGLGYVVAVRTDFAGWIGFRQVRAKALLAEAWCRLSSGDGGKRPRLYDWDLVRTNCTEPTTYSRWLHPPRRHRSERNRLFRLRRSAGDDARRTPRVAGRHWTIEEDFELAKGDCGLDEYEVRSWNGRYRHVTLSLWALVVATLTRSRTLQTPPQKKRMQS